MAKPVSAAQARNNFAEIIGKAHFGDETFVVERLGKPFAVIIGYNEYQKLLEVHEELQRAQEERTSVNYDQARLL